MNKIYEFFDRIWIKACNWLLMHWRWLASMRLYVIADATDNSVTFSRDLFRLLDVMGEDEAKVFVFRLCNATSEDPNGWSGTIYAFTVNPPIKQETQLADIQFNQKHRCIGFECLCPTVNQIFYDYQLPAMSKAKLSVIPCADSNAGTKMKYYIIMPPKK